MNLGEKDVATPMKSLQGVVLFLCSLFPVLTAAQDLPGVQLETVSSEDIVQEVLFGIHNARHTYDSSKPFMPWFNAIIRYKTIDAFRKVGRNKEDELSTGEDIETFFQDDANKQMQALDRHDLMNALAQLPEKPRQAVILMKLHGLTADDAGKVFGM